MQVENVHHGAWFISTPQPLCQVNNNNIHNNNGKFN
jgi:hypothetical protein